MPAAAATSTGMGFAGSAGTGALAIEALAAKRRGARHGCPAAALVREADEEHARDADRPRTEQEDRLERGKTRHQRETNSAGATVVAHSTHGYPQKPQSRAEHSARFL